MPLPRQPGTSIYASYDGSAGAHGSGLGFPLGASSGLPCACTPGGPTRCSDVLCLGSTLTVVSNSGANSSAASGADTSNLLQSPDSEASDFSTSASPDQPRFGRADSEAGGHSMAHLQEEHRLGQEAELRQAREQNLKLVETIRTLQMQLAQPGATNKPQAGNTAGDLRAQVCGGVDESPGPSASAAPHLYEQLDAAVAKLNQTEQTPQAHVQHAETPDYSVYRYNLASRPPLLAHSPPAAMASQPPDPQHVPPPLVSSEVARLTSLLEHLEGKLQPVLQDLSAFKQVRGGGEGRGGEPGPLIRVLSFKTALLSNRSCMRWRSAPRSSRKWRRLCRWWWTERSPSRKSLKSR